MIKQTITFQLKTKTDQFASAQEFSSSCYFCDQIIRRQKQQIRTELKISQTICRSHSVEAIISIIH